MALSSSWGRGASRMSSVRVLEAPSREEGESMSKSASTDAIFGIEMIRLAEEIEGAGGNDKAFRDREFCFRHDPGKVGRLSSCELPAGGGQGVQRKNVRGARVGCVHVEAFGSDRGVHSAEDGRKLGIGSGSHALQRSDHEGNGLGRLLIGLDHGVEVRSFVLMIELFQDGHLLMACVVRIQESSESLVGLAEDLPGREGLVKEAG